MEEQMKTQTQGKIIFALVASLFTILLVSGVLAQAARSNTWVSPSSGITVTVTSPPGSIPKNSVVYKFEGTGKIMLRKELVQLPQHLYQRVVLDIL